MSPTLGDRLKLTFITVLGSGYAPIASGTWGSLVAVGAFGALWWAVAANGAARAALEFATGSGVLISSLLSVLWGPWATAHFARKDPKPFVLDEFAGQWMALAYLPVAMEAGLASVAAVLLTQFLLFRVFDIVKPPPARQLERLPHGWGILLDDIFAGLYANIAGQLLWRFTPLAETLGLGGFQVFGAGN